MKKICIITGSRAEWGLLSGLAAEIEKDVDLKLQIIATNMHLSPEFGQTYREIEKDGFVIDKKVNMLLSGDTSNATAKSCGLAIIGLADAFEDLQPDLIVILGDRYEMLAAAYTALLYKIPVAHLHGGEITEGAYDDAMRHAITKMSHLHFASTEQYCRNIIQMGEDPQRVFHVGAIGCENISRTPLMTRDELEQSLDFKFGEKSLLVTYHPVTLGNHSTADQIRNLLEVLVEYQDYKIIFTQPNSDTDGLIISKLLQQYAAEHPEQAKFYTSLGKVRYLSALKYMTAVVGNSSSGLIEVPSFGIPTLNIGDRQKGRIAAESVIHCGPSRSEIHHGMKKILGPEFINFCQTVKNPYEKPDTARAIYRVIKDFPTGKVQKRFYSINSGNSLNV